MRRPFMICLLGLLACLLSWAHAPKAWAEGEVTGPASLPTVMIYSYENVEDNEDSTYKDLCLKSSTTVPSAESEMDPADNGEGESEDEVRGSRFSDCMPHKRTKLMSALELNQWYLTNLQCSSIESCILKGNKNGKPYVGPLYRGDENIYRYINRLVETDAPGLAPNQQSTVDTCNKIITPNSGTDPYNPATTRLELDSCTNQYILHRANLPRIPVDNVGELPDIKEGREEGFCQPIRMLELGEGEQEEEFNPGEYYATAWGKTMEDAGYLVRGGLAMKEPNYSRLGVSIEHPIEMREDYGKVTINDMVEFPYERIYDPTHPFSPRWDFKSTDRILSVMTTYYSKDPITAVRCSGKKNSSSDLSIDVMTWREPAWQFYMQWRIGFNIVCKILEDYTWFKCWTIFDGENDDPPCPTKWDGKEKVEERGGMPLRWILCGPPHIVELCEHITKPVAPANVLKMRDSKDEEIFPEGVPKGYTFSEYFGKHRPYMRCWDTGLECARHEDGPPPRGYGEKDEYVGSGDHLEAAEYAILGAGREGESCLIGGGDGSTSSQVDMMADPIMDWMELKLYVTRGMREFGINCIPKYEKTFKVGTGEDILNTRAGGTYQKLVKDSKGNLTQYVSRPWPLAWRGYVSDPDDDQRYPDLGDGGGSTLTGLDGAMVGDILIYDEDVVGTARLPYLAYVTEINNASSEESDENKFFVKAIAYNHGKFPDACGNTDDWGQGEEYTMYKTALPPHNQKLLENSGHPGTCDDPRLSACIENLWGSVKRYRPIQ